MRRMFLAFMFAMFLSPLAVSAQDTNALLNDLRASRAAYPAVMSRAQAAEWLNNFALTHPGWGMLRKGSGNSCPIHGTYVSCDILIFAPTIVHYDVAMGADFDGEPNMNPTFNSDGPCVIGPSSGCAMSNFQEPFPSDGQVPSAPSAPPSAPPASGGNSSLDSAIRSFIEDVRAAIGRIETNQAELRQQVQDFDNRTSATLAAHVTVSPAGITFPVYRGTFSGMGLILRPEGK